MDPRVPCCQEETKESLWYCKWEATGWLVAEEEKKAFGSEMFVRGFWRELHHYRESNLCPARDSHWHHKETFLTLVLLSAHAEAIVHLGRKLQLVISLANPWLGNGGLHVTVWWANHFPLRGEHIVLCFPLLLFVNEQGYFWCLSYLRLNSCDVFIYEVRQKVPLTQHTVIWWKTLDSN